MIYIKSLKNNDIENDIFKIIVFNLIEGIMNDTEN